MIPDTKTMENAVNKQIERFCYCNSVLQALIPVLKELNGKKYTKKLLPKFNIALQNYDILVCNDLSFWGKTKYVVVRKHGDLYDADNKFEIRFTDENAIISLEKVEKENEHCLNVEDQISLLQEKLKLFKGQYQNLLCHIKSIREIQNIITRDRKGDYIYPLASMLDILK